MTRLIDADALKAEIKDNGYSHYFEIFSIIDNAPTVDTGDSKYLEERDADAWESGYIQGLSEQRPQGEWLLLSEKQPPKSGYYITSTIYNEVFCDYWSVDHFDRIETVIAWQPLPEPYKKGGAE